MSFLKYSVLPVEIPEYSWINIEDELGLQVGARTCMPLSFAKALVDAANAANEYRELLEAARDYFRRTAEADGFMPVLIATEQADAIDAALSKQPQPEESSRE